MAAILIVTTQRKAADMFGLGMPEFLLVLLSLVGIVAPIAAALLRRLSPLEALLAVVAAAVIPGLGGAASIAFTLYRCNHRGASARS